MTPEDTLRMPAPELSSLLGFARDGEEPVFLLVRRRAPRPTGTERFVSSTVSIVLLVALVLGTALLAALR